MKRIALSKKKKIAFVCSGGAAKAGAFHLGVALALQEKGFKFVGGLKREAPADAAAEEKTSEKLEFTNENGRSIEVYVGASAGAIICSYLVSGYTLDQIFNSFLGDKKGKQEGGKSLKRLSYREMFSLRKDLGIMDAINNLASESKVGTLTRVGMAIAKGSLDSLLKLKFLKTAGIFSTAGIEKYLREDVLPSNDFQSYKPDLFIVGTQLNHSKKVVFGKYLYSPPFDDRTVAYVNNTLVSEACAASVALPLIFSPYPIKNEKGNILYYFDGEVRDTLSTHVAFDAGADLIIASYTHQPYHYSREIGSLHKFGMPVIMIQALYLLIERKIQSSINMHQRHQLVLEESDRFFKEHNISDHLRKKYLNTLERQLGHKKGVDYIYIHPKPTDHQMFFGDHFNLSGRRMKEIVRSGFRSAIDVLRRYEFD